MCNVCVMEGVKQSMLSLFAGAAASGLAAAGAGITTARPALAQATGRVVDLTPAYDGSFPTFDCQPGIFFEETLDGASAGYQIS